MAYTLRLTDGTDTIDFMTADFQLEDGGLVIQPPKESDTWGTPTEEGGAPLVESKRGNREARVTFQISGTTRQAIRERKNRINAMLKTARMHSLGKTATRVSFLYGWDGASEVDYFEVLMGTLHMPEDVMSVEKQHGKFGDLYAITECEIELVLSANAYGISPSTGSLIELALRNRNTLGSYITGGAMVMPFTDAGTAGLYEGGFYADSYVEVRGSDIGGDAPALVRLEITNSSMMHGIDTVIVGAQTAPETGSYPNLYVHWSDPSIVAKGGSVYSAPNAMRGTRLLLPETSPIPYENPLIDESIFDQVYGQAVELFRVKISNGAAYKYAKYRVMFFTGSISVTFPQKIAYQLRVISSRGSILMHGPVVEQYYDSTSRKTVLDAGEIQLPPFDMAMGTPQDFYLELVLLPRASSPNAESFRPSLNYMWFIPSEQGYRHLSTELPLELYTTDVGSGGGSGIPTIVDDGWAGTTYLKDSQVAGGLPVVQPHFTPIKLQPGKDHRIYFTFLGRDYVVNDLTSFSVRLFYTPNYTGAV